MIIVQEGRGEKNEAYRCGHFLWGKGWRMMIICEGYSVKYVPKDNQIIITLPQTFKTITNTVQMLTDRKMDITDDDLAQIMSLVKYICER